MIFSVPFFRIRKSLTKFTILLTLCSIACKSPEREFWLANKSEKLGRYPTAISVYENFVQKNPQHARSPEALFRIGEIYRTVIKDFSKARIYYEKVMDAYKSSPWSTQAEQSFMNSPDYFPLAPNLKRTMGDSQSGGTHMRTEEKIESLKDTARRYKIEKKIFAGEQTVSADEHFYEKKDKELREYQPGNPAYAVILRYPPVKDLSWESLRHGKRILFSIEADNLSMEVKAGVFLNCLKVKQRSEESKTTWKYDYYAPSVGLILTSAGTEKNETRIIELLSYQPVEKEFLSASGKQSKFVYLMQKIKTYIKKVKDLIRKK